MPAVPTRITDLAHLAEAARRLGQSDRVIQVDVSAPQVVRTPGGRVGHWLVSGEPLVGPGSSTALAEAVDRAAERDETSDAVADRWSGGALAEVMARGAEREEYSR
ncbi:hypothetical protein [Nocardia bovistercoris]|uniref:Uncharacterized protein n=1 Tax=Nocardia bovistercoris TaxID=2785916 RepID=A0A931ICH3_9NOCA|nr:hypothetical protein [Nocardia bovistercoris]MBH0777273.1 hypothetical protein [Nocardia bovistercoris]